MRYPVLLLLYLPQHILYTQPLTIHLHMMINFSVQVLTVLLLTLRAKSKVLMTGNHDYSHMIYSPTPTALIIGQIECPWTVKFALSFKPAPCVVFAGILMLLIYL